jgi:hypothetical protein
MACLSAGVLMFAACKDGTGPASSGSVGVGFRLASASPTTASVLADALLPTGTAASVSTSAEGLTIQSGSDVIVISLAQLVVRDVKLKPASATCSDDDSNATASNSSSTDDDDDECPTIHVGPYLVNVPVSGVDGSRVTVDVPEGAYSSVRLTVHKVTSSDSADLRFRQAHPDLRDMSIRLEGTYNGTPFVFVSDVNAKLEVPLTQPFTVKEGGDNVTVTIDIAGWFTRPDGGLYSPATANTPGQVQAKVQNNIRSAFRAFHDRNRDGRED